jgi:hypothetical protein
MTGYPRDLVGYVDQPPDPRWPGGARLALNFVVNYEEGGERSVLGFQAQTLEIFEAFWIQGVGMICRRRCRFISLSRNR